MLVLLLLLLNEHYYNGITPLMWLILMWC